MAWLACQSAAIWSSGYLKYSGHGDGRGPPKHPSPLLWNSWHNRCGELAELDEWDLAKQIWDYLGSVSFNVDRKYSLLQIKKKKKKREVMQNKPRLSSESEEASTS